MRTQARFFVGCVLCFTTFLFAEDKEIAEVFSQRGIVGTMILKSVETGKTFVHNDSRAKTRYSPASTFKILHTLIAMQNNVILGIDHKFIWDGTVYEISNWNEDQTLSSAFHHSCVWCYQKIASQIEPETYRQAIVGAEYGTLNTEFNSSAFWLDGSLQVSAYDQVMLLQKIVNRELDYSVEAFETLQQVMLEKQTENHALWAKTGWFTRGDPSIGWYVGYVKLKDYVWVFALNMDLDNAQKLPLRKEIVEDVLRAKINLESDCSQ